MPKTSFSCRDKILGGYYADSETQCQMFHVCVKVSGIGVQDFRFLCPNGTAFDQEAQICADWGDVDCEAATLYYGSDNFDLYRLGSGFESKRAPFAEEEEATFHLQRAETSDARRSKQFIVNQSSKPQQPPVHPNPNQIPSVQRPQQQQQLQQHHQQQHHHHRQSPVTTTTTTTTTTTSTTAAPFYSTTENYFNKASNLQYQKQIQQKHQQHKQQQLAYNQQQQIQQQQYRQLTAAAATATPADRARHADELRSTTPTSFPSNHQPAQRTSDNSNDEIFRGSHSSHFFNNRNNGKEDFDDDFVRRPAASTTSPTTTARPQASNNATRSTQSRGRNRGRGSVRAHNLNIVRSEAKPTPARQQQTRLQATTPEDFFDVPKIQNFSRGSTHHNNNNNNNFRQQPTTVLQPQTDNKINFGQQQQQQQQPASTPAPFSRGQRPTQNAATSRSSNAFFQQQQTNTTPARSIAQQYQTTTPAAQRFQQQQQQVNTTPRPQNFQQQQQQQVNTTPRPQNFQQQQQQQINTTPRPQNFQQQQQQVNTTPRPQNFQQFQTTTNVPLNQQRYQPPSTPAAANQHFTDFNNQFFAPNPSSTPPPNINYQFFSRNPSTPAPAQNFNRNPTTQAPVQNFNRNPTTTAPAQNFNRVTQAPQFYNTGFENKATERSFNEPITTPQESQRTRAQSRSFNIDPARLNQFNYNEYQGSRTSTTTTTTAAPTPAAAALDIKPSTYNPISYRQQQQPQQPLRQHPPSFNVNPFDPRSTAASVSITTTSTTLRPVSNNDQRYQTISRSASDNYTPSTIKKFSTLVPKDQYNPTTFKPNALSKKALLQFVIQKPEKQEKIVPAPVKSTVYVPTVPPVSITTTTTTTQAPRKQPQSNNIFQQPQQQQPRPTTTTTTTTTTTQRPQDIDEDDGQYHPELYEKDFYRNRVKAKFNQERKQNSQDPLTSSRNNFFQQSTPVSQSLSTSDEDEIFRTAHSQNIAASGNDLILERARQAAAKINEFLSSSSVKPTAPAPTKKSHHHHHQSAKDANQRVNPRPFSKAPTIPPNATSTKRPADDKEEYDYAYYDTGSPDVPEYDIIEDFGRTSAHKKNKKN